MKAITLPDSLLDILSTNVAALLKNHNDYSDFVHDNSTTATICSVLEAVFMHNSVQRTVYVSAASNSPDKLSFWGFIQTFAPRHLLDSLSTPESTLTNVGRCRTWIRYCLNEGTFQNYLSAASEDVTMLKFDSSFINMLHFSVFYDTDALIQDNTFVANVTKQLDLLRDLRFRLDMTSPLLNTWDGSMVFELLGWLSTNISTDSCGTYSGSIIATASCLSGISSHVSPSSLSAQANQLSLSSGVPRAQPISSLGFNKPLSSIRDSSEVLANSGVLSEQFSVVHNRSFACQQISSLSSSNCIYPIGSNSLINQANGSWLSATCFQDNVEKVENAASESPIESKSVYSVTLPEVIRGNSTIVTEDDSTWQVVGEDLLVVLTDEDVDRLVNLFPGASSFDMNNGRNCAFQGQCNRCERRLTQVSSFLDHYDACLYCINCHQLQESIIPRDVVYNWDFSLQPVSQPTKSFLLGVFNKPIINLAKLNPSLYAVVSELRVIRQLRRAVVLLWYQIARCDAKVASDLRSCLHPLDYVLLCLNDLDLYSLRDLCHVQSGQMEAKLAYAITNVALAHVHSCHACLRRALLCDVCGDLRRPIWPHEFSTYKWCAIPGCMHVMHVDCLANITDRPTNDTWTSCLSCNSAFPANTSRLTIAARCRTCSLYEEVLPTRTVGHYADPFLPNSTEP